MKNNKTERKYGDKNPSNNKGTEIIRAIGAVAVAGTTVLIKVAKSERGNKIIASGMKNVGKVIQKL